jgi:hypothetical protein
MSHAWFEGTTDLIFLHEPLPNLFFSITSELSIVDLSILAVIGQLDSSPSRPSRIGYRSIADLSILTNQRSSVKFVSDTSFC